jgi:menaquinone-dependent protoporphyrinogen oxidase
MHGATTEIAEAIADTLRRRGLDVDVIAPERVDNVERYDAVVLGSAVYVGHWLEPARQLARQHAAQLARRPVWLFSSGPVGDPARKLVQKMAVDPVEVPEIRQATHAREHRLFAGKLDRKHLTRVQRASLLFFRGIEGDFRDWKEIEQWAAGIADNLQPGSQPSVGETLEDSRSSSGAPPDGAPGAVGADRR